MILNYTHSQVLLNHGPTYNNQARTTNPERPGAFSLTDDICLVPTDVEGQMVTNQDISVLEEFASHVLANVVARTYYKRQKRLGCLSSWATVSDEAFALLCLENGEDVWLEEKTSLENIRNSGKEPKKRKKGSKFNGSMKPKYTMLQPEDTENSNLKNTFVGWTKQGLRRYNDLCRQISNARGETTRQALETFLLQQTVERYAASRPGRVHKKPRTRILEDDEDETCNESRLNGEEYMYRDWS
jgi:hypothetical protein